ncbi:unnamed protein product [Eretmochelys imbricata]
MQEREVRETALSLKTGTSPDSDGLPPELYWELLELLMPVLTNVFNSSLHHGALSPSQYDTILVLLTKLGVLTDIRNWRPIALLNTDYKILARVLKRRLGEAADRLVHCNQSNAVGGWTVADSSCSVREVCECACWKQWEGHLLALDQSKAFDHVNLNYLWKVHKQYGLLGDFIRWLQVLYKQALVYPLVNGWLGNKVPVHMDVKQSCPLSPFCMCCVWTLF